MGIPGLYTKLQPYGNPIAWSPSQRGSNGTLIIDAPAFAFWVYFACYSERRAGLPKSSSFEAVPSYKEVGASALRRLDAFEQCGLSTKHIFFDGALPESKMETRCKRAQDSIDQLQAFHTRVPMLEINPRAPSYVDLFIDHPGPRLPPLPVASFLVSAMIEALLDSAYHDRVEVVPCEADPKCVDPEICTVDDIILTGDTDLVVHDSPARVLFLNDIEFTVDSVRTEGINGRLYQSRALAAQSGVSDWVRFAFHLRQDQHASLAVAAARSKKQIELSELDSFAFESFRQDYLLDDLLASARGGVLPGISKHLDPRVSELVQQCLGTTEPREELVARIFLGSMLDDPTRASSWRASADIRQLGYSILASCVRGPFKVVEVDRRGGKVARIDVQTLAQEAVKEGAKHQADAMLRILRSYDSWTENSCWRLYALHTVMAWEMDSGKHLPSKSKANRLVTGQQKRCSWEDVHLSAQIEGVLYSLRMLRQLLGVCVAYGELQDTPVSIDSNMKILFETLGSMPAIQELMPRPLAALRIEASVDELDQELASFYPQRAEVASKQANKRRTRQAKGTGDRINRQASSSASNNMYALLAGVNAK